MTRRQARLQKQLLGIKQQYVAGQLSYMAAGKALDALIDKEGGGKQELKDKARDQLLVKAPKKHVEQSLKEVGEAVKHAGTLWTQGVGELAQESGRRNLTDKERKAYQIGIDPVVTGEMKGHNSYQIGRGQQLNPHATKTFAPVAERPLNRILNTYTYDPNTDPTKPSNTPLGAGLMDLYDEYIHDPLIKPVKQFIHEYGTETLEENKADMAKVPPANTTVGQAAQSIPRSFPATGASIASGLATGVPARAFGKTAAQVAGRTVGTSIGLAAAPNQLAAEATSALINHPLLKEEFANLNDAEVERDLDALKSLVNELVFEEKFLNWAQALQAGGALPLGGWFTRMLVDSASEGIEEGLDDTVIVGTVVNEAVKRHLRYRKSPLHNSPDLVTNRTDWVYQNPEEVSHAAVVGAIASVPTNAMVATAERLIEGKAPTEQDRIVNETKKRIEEAQANDPDALTKAPELTEEHQRLMNRTLNRYKSLPKEDKAALFKEPDVQVLIEDILNKEAVGDPLTPDQLQLSRLFRKEVKDAQEAPKPEAPKADAPKADKQPTTDGMPDALPKGSKVVKKSTGSKLVQPAKAKPPKTKKPAAPKPTTDDSPVRKAFDSLTPEQRQEFAKDFNKKDGTPGKKAQKILDAKSFDELDSVLKGVVRKQQDRLEKILKAPVKTPEADQTVTKPDTKVDSTVEESSMPDSSKVVKGDPPPAPEQQSKSKPKSKKVKPEPVPEPNVKSTVLPEGEVKTESPESPSVPEPDSLNKQVPVVPPEAKPVQEEARADTPPEVKQGEVEVPENPKPDTAQEVEQQSKTPTASNTDALPEVETTTPTAKALDAVEDMPEAPAPVAEPVEDVVEQPEAGEAPEVEPLAEEPTTEDSPLKTEDVYDAMSEEERTKLAEEFRVDGEPTKISKHIIAKPVFKDLPKTVQRRLKKLDVDGKLLERAKRSVTAPDTTIDTTPTGTPLEDASKPVEEMGRTTLPEAQDSVPDTAQPVSNPDTTIAEPADTSQGLPEAEAIQTESPKTPTPALVSSKPAALPKKVASTSKQYAKLVLLDLDLITSSHDLDGAVNEGYAAAGGVQPRDDRTALAADDDLQKMVAEPEAPRFLSNSPDPGVGAPIITTGGAVLSGNNRTRALQYLKQQDMASFWADYDRNLLEDAEALGFDRAALEQQLENAANDGKRLVMVRQFDGDLDATAAAKIADMENDPAVSARSDAQKATRIANKLTATDIPALLTEDGIAVTNKSSIDRVRKLLSDEDQKLVFDQNGNLTNAGVRLMTLALIEHAYGRTVTNRVALDQVPSSQIKALVQAVPTKLRMDQAINALESDTLAEMDITEQWMTALPIYAQLDEDGRINSDFSNILDYHTFEDPIIPMLVKAMRNGGRKASIKSMTTRLKTYNNRVADAATPMATEQLNKEDLVREIFAEGEEQTSNQGSLFNEVEATEETVPTEAGGGLTVDPNTPRGKAYMNKRMLEVMVDVARETFANNVDVQVVATLKEAQAIIGRPDVAFGGVSYTGRDGTEKVMLVADVLEAEAQLDGKDFLKRGVEVYYHESVGHAGLKIAAGGPGQFKAYNQKVYNARKKEIDKWHRKRYDFQYKDGRIQDADWVKASEWLAQNFAEKGLKPPKITDRLTFNLAGRLMRRRGTNAEIRLNYDRIYKNLTKGRKPKLRAIGQDEIPPTEPERKLTPPPPPPASTTTTTTKTGGETKKTPSTKSGKSSQPSLGLDDSPHALLSESAPGAFALFSESNPADIVTWFSGGGTLEAGLTNVESISAVEYDQAILEAYNAAHGTNYTARDIKAVDPKEVAMLAPDLFHASPVCKNFSKAKTLKGATELDRISAEQVAKVITQAQPPLVTIENVPEYANTALFGVITDALDVAGYNWDLQIHDAADYGSPQSRKRMLVRARLDGQPLPPVPEKTGPTDWYELLKDDLENAPDAPFQTRTRPVNWEVERIDNMIARGSLDSNLPIITMGGSAGKSVANARNSGGPSPTLLASHKQAVRVLYPDGRVKLVTPEMMRKLMGLPESYPLPQAGRGEFTNAYGYSKTILGNGISGYTSRTFIQPLLNSPNTTGINEPLFSEIPSDKEYMDAVKRGDMEAAQEMVNQAAEAKGYNLDNDYKGQHSAPNSKYDVSLLDLRDSDLLPDDYFTHPQYYTNPYDPISKEAHRRLTAALRRVDALREAGRDGMADSATMLVYRARPKNKEETPRNGDWVTPVKEYAKQHMAGEKGWHIQQIRAKLSDLYFDGNDPQELGYDTGENLVYGDTRNNRKRIDPVTYDAEGNVIPLSKRFNKRESSTLFSETNQFPEKGINVRTDKKAGRQYADLIVDGQKTYESRNSDSLRPYVGQRVSIVRTGEGQAQAIGAVTIGEPIVVGEAKFRALEDQHMVPAGSDFDIRPGGTKYLYPLKDPVRVNEQAELGRGIVSRKVTTPGNQQGELFSEALPLMQDAEPLFSAIKRPGSFWDYKKNLQGRTEYEHYKQWFRGLQFDAIKLGKDTADIFYEATRAGEQAALYEYFTTPGADPNQISDRVIKSSFRVLGMRFPRPTISNTLYTLGTLGIANRKFRQNYGSLRDAAIAAKARINQHGQELVNLGMLPPETLQKYGDQYLPKMYLKYLLSDDHRRVITAGGSLKASQMNYLKKRKDTDPVLMAVFGQELKDPAYLSALTIIQQGKDIALMRFLKKLLDESTPVRDEDGNIVENARQNWVLENKMVDINYADIVNQVIQQKGLNLTQDRLPQMARQTSTKQLSPEFVASEADRLDKVVGEIYAKDSTLGQLVEGVAARMRQLATAERPEIDNYNVEDYAKLPDSPRYGVLRGAWVRKEIEQELVNSAGMPSNDDVARVSRKISSVWKWMVVAFSPVAWAGNIASNTYNMWVGAGLDPVRGLVYRLRAVNELMKMYQGRTSSRLRRYEKEGLTLSTFAANELDRIDVKMESRIQVMERGIMGGSLARLKEIGRLFMDFFGDRYQDIELMDKIAVAMFLEGKGKSSAEAIQQANYHLFDYTEVPNWIQNGTFGRNSPLGMPFVTWMYKFMGWQGAQLKKPRALIRVGLYAATFTAVREALKADLDDEEERLFYASLPAYLRRKGKLFVIPSKERDANGKVIAIDMSMWFPLQVPFSLLANTLPNIEGVPRDIKNMYSDEQFDVIDAMNELGFLGNPIASTAMEMLSNRDSFTNKPIYDKFGMDAGWEMAEHLVKQFTPYFHMKMLEYSLGKPIFGDSLTVDRMGNPKSTRGVEGAKLSGFRPYSIDVEQGLSFEARRITEAGRRAVQKYVTAQNRGMTPAEEAKAERELEKKLKNYERQLKKLEGKFDIEKIAM